MEEESIFEPHDWTDWDSFQLEAESFIDDVHVLILDIMRAARTRLNDEASKDDAVLIGHLETATGNVVQRLAEDQADLWIGIAYKERFLRTQALVSLMSRLTHSLLSMARSAEHWAAPRQQRDHDTVDDDGRDEFKRIWRDYRERLGLDLGPKYIDFVDRYRRARNRIVHNGGEANPYLPPHERDFEAGFDGMLDLSFSTKYPDFVNGESFNAQIDITDELLEIAVERSLQLVKYAAQQLRIKEVEAEKARKSGQK